MKHFSNLVLVWIFSCFFKIECAAQLTVSNTMTPEQLVQNVLLGAGVTATNITFTGSPNAKGTFNGSGSNIGLSGGILLTTGSIFNAPGPNNALNSGTDNSLPGDATLSNLAGTNTMDATILEFDFVPTTDTIRFRYVFASEEYNEYVCSNYNDAFAFFISGPGITGQKNIALIPGTSTPVTINRVNNGTCGINGAFHTGCDLSNSVYFINNENPSGTSVQYDGFTTVLTAQTNVSPCLTYHFRLAIADALDGTYDSGVFLEAGSFNSGVSVNASAQPTSGIQVPTGIIGCAPFTATFLNTSTGTNHYLWNFGDGSPLDTMRNPTHTYLQGGNYTIQLIAADSSVCNFSDTANFSLLVDSGHLSPSFNLVQYGQCDSIRVHVTSTSGGEFLHYAWDFGEGVTSSGIRSSYLYHTLGTYPIQLVVTDTICHLTDSAFQQVSLLPRIQSSIIASENEGCAPLNLTMCYADPSMTGSTKVQWNFGNGAASNSICDSVYYTDPGIYYTRLIVTDTSTCNKKDTSLVRVYAKVTPHALFNLPDSQHVFDPLFLENTSENGQSYFWNFDDGETSTQKYPVHEFIRTGNYTICLVASQNSCWDSVCRVLRVYDNPQAVWLPASFSPNGDGKNDFFSPDGIGIASLQMSIYDRWGEKVFESTDKKEGWDGMYKGVPVANGVFVVHLKATLLKNETIEKMVPLTLIR